jgi:hypothetical protein
MAAITKPLHQMTNPKHWVDTSIWVGTLIWARGRKILILLLLAVLAILLASTTPPVIIHQQHLHVLSAQSSQPQFGGTGSECTEKLFACG